MSAAAEQVETTMTHEIAATSPTPLPARQPGPMPEGIAPMVQMVASGQITVDQLDSLLALQERHEAAQARREYNMAMAEFRATVPAAVKDSNGNNNTRYASFGSVMDAINGPLGMNGFNVDFKHSQDDKSITVACTITHRGGHSESTSLTAGFEKLGNSNAVQSLGGLVSYLKRYTVSSLTGVATEDDDGQSAVKPAADVLGDAEMAELRKRVTDSGGDVGRWEKHIAVAFPRGIPVARRASVEADIDSAATARQKKAAQP